MIGGPIIALMPLVMRDLLQSRAPAYGIMLGAFGLGAVIGALNHQGAPTHERRDRRSDTNYAGHRVPYPNRRPVKSP
jgi:hypothetical protein